MKQGARYLSIFLIITVLGSAIFVGSSTFVLADSISSSGYIYLDDVRDTLIANHPGDSSRITDFFTFINNRLYPETPLNQYYTLVIVHDSDSDNWLICLYACDTAARYSCEFYSGSIYLSGISNSSNNRFNASYQFYCVACFKSNGEGHSVSYNSNLYHSSGIISDHSTDFSSNTIPTRMEDGAVPSSFNFNISGREIYVSDDITSGVSGQWSSVANILQDRVRNLHLH